MQIPNISLAYLIAELSPLLEDSILRKVQELENNWLKLKLQTRQGTKDLILAPDTFFVTSYSLPAKQTSSGFGAFLRKRISNKKILSLKQHGLDRIVLFEFDEYFLILELFAKGNVILTTKEMEIVSAYRKEQWKDQKISKTEQYKFPSSKGANPLEITSKEFKEILSKSNSDCIRTIVSKLNIAPVAGEEACLNAGIDKSKDAKSLETKEILKLAKELKQLYTVDIKKLKPGVSENQILPFEMKSAISFQKAPSLNEAIDEHFSSEIAEKKAETVEGQVKKAKQDKRLEIQVESEKELLERAEAERLKAEAIYSNYQGIKSAIELAKAFEKGKLTKEEVMYKVSELGFEVKKIDLKDKKLFLKLDN